MTDVSPQQNPVQNKPDPCAFVIFGVRGDLTHRLVIPALYNLAAAGLLPDRFCVVGVARIAMSSDEVRDSLMEGLKKFATRPVDEAIARRLLECVSSIEADPKDPASFDAMRDRLEKLETDRSTAGNRLFYLATPPSAFAPIGRELGRAGLLKEEGGAWRRPVVEKPFGHDLTSARELNKVLQSVFNEEDVYRIDHYLGKETVQNILVFRFGNLLFEPIWNRNYIDYVEITAAEVLGVEQRAGFYEETGALRDMVANHMLQLLSLTAMEPPLAFDASSVRGKKVEVLSAIRPMTIEEVAERTVRGQYGPGQIDGKPVPGYHQEPGVAPASKTETFAGVQFFIDNWRWAGVPFFLRSGKRLSRNLTEIAVHFKRTPQTLFVHESDNEVERNVIAFRIQPNEGISVDFAAKRPGTEMHTANVQLNFRYREAFGTKSPVAYETLLLDAMRGDATLFTRRDEAEAEWRLITPIEDAWANLPAPKFPNYAAGSAGPDAADLLIAHNGWSWRTLDPLA